MNAARPAHHRIRKASFVCAIAFCAFAAFGISGPDESAMRGIDEATARWQANPEFRAISIEYCVSGSRVLRTRPFFCRARSIVVTIRSIPLLPKPICHQPDFKAALRQLQQGAAQRVPPPLW